MNIESIDGISPSKQRVSPMDRYLAMMQLQPAETGQSPANNPMAIIGSLMQSIGDLLSSLMPLLQQLQQMGAGNMGQASSAASNLAQGLPDPQESFPTEQQSPYGSPAVGNRADSAGGGRPGSAAGSQGTGGFSPAPTTGGPLSEAQGKQMGVDVAQQLMKDFGLSKEQAAGIVGNLYHESAGMNPNVNEFGSDPNSPTYGKPNDSQFGYGWAQWTGSRKTDYLNFCKEQGLDPSSPAANYAMLKHELETTEAGTIDAMKGAQTPEQAAQVFREVFERATNPVDAKRKEAANEIYGMMG